MSEYIYQVETKLNTFDNSFSLNRREEIVRCKNCACMEQRISFDGSICWFLCTYFNRPTRRDGYCAWGEWKNT